MKYALAAAAVAAVTLGPAEVAGDCVVDASKRSDCGYVGVTQDQCEAKGCCWQPLTSNSPSPWCFYPDSDPTGYKLTSWAETATGFAGTLQLRASPISDDIATLSLEVIMEDNDYVHVRITDPKKTRWEVPQSLIPRKTVTVAAPNPAYSVTYTTEPFTLTVTRKADGAVVFKSDAELIFKDQLLQLRTAADPSAATFGLGESTRAAQRLAPGTTVTMWNADIPSLVFGDNLYGSHPMYLQLLPGGAAHGALLLSSSGMDVSVLSDAVSFRALGGMADLYVFAGPSPQAVVAQFQRVVGLPAMVPYWSLGFHNCRYGYTSVYEIEDVVANYAQAGIPLETQWADIDYMEAYKDFTLDPNNFPQSEMAALVSKLHASNQRFVPIIDPGIMVQPGYDAYERGVSEGLFVTDVAGKPYMGQVWPGPVHFPDFLNPATGAYWRDQLAAFRDLVPYDGLWIDMNEVSNFCNVDGRGQTCYNPGGCPNPSAQTTCCLACSTPQPSNPLDFPPYGIGNKQGGGLLGTKTMPMSAVHYGNVTEYDAHNLYGISEAKATREALLDITAKRPFILTRSSFLGQGQYSAHWTGDNAATFDDLKASIVTINNFALFGVPMVGADTCGFIGETTSELCSRWIELSAFTPFVRDHSTLGATPHELYMDSTVAAAAKNALALRYKLLPYIYTLMYMAHRDGAMVMRPLWANFPQDGATWAADRQFMLGDALLVSPALDQGATSVQAYFPQAGGRWYSLTSGSFGYVDTSAGPVTLTLDTPITAVNVHIRGGFIVPTQQSGMTTTQVRNSPMRLLVPLCAQGKASGSLFLDDGEQPSVEAFTLVAYAATTSSVTATVQTNGYARAGFIYIESVVVAGLAQAPQRAFLDGKELAVSCVSFDASTGKALFTGIKVPANAAFSLTWQ